jgi:hypothetical protein
VLVTGIITTYLVLRLVVRRGFLDTYPLDEAFGRLSELLHRTIGESFGCLWNGAIRSLLAFHFHGPSKFLHANRIHESLLVIDAEVILHR